MALGTNRTRNWGREAQMTALALTLRSKRVAYKVITRNLPHLIRTGRQRTLWLAASANGVTLPFTESVATLVNKRRGHWVAESILTGELLAQGVSLKDVIRNTVEKVWQ